MAAIENKTKQFNKMDRFALQWAELVIKNRLKTVFFTIVVFLIMAAGLMQIQASHNYRVFFSDKNPDLLTFEKFEETYTKNDNFLFVVKPKSGSIDQPFVAQATEEFTARAWTIPFAIRVDSITNFQHTYAIDDDLIVEDLIEDASSLSQAEIAKRVDIALNEPLLAGNLVALDRGASGINVTLQYPGLSEGELPEAINFARALVAEFEQDYPDLRIALTGISALNAAFFEATINDAETLYGPMFLVLIVITWLVIRSFSGVVATVLVITFATMAAMGFAGWAGIIISPFSGSAPVVILTLAIVDSIHILITMVQRMRVGDDKIEAIKESIRVNFLAVSITSLTTIIGFLALNFSDAPPFNALGNISAVGIAAAWFYSLTFLPALLAILPFNVQTYSDKSRGPLQEAINKLAEFVIARARATLVFVSILFIGLACAIPTIDLNDQWVEYFDDRVEFRGDAKFAINHLTGLYILEYSVPAGAPGAISEPKYLQDLDDFAIWLREYSKVRHVYTYTDVIKRLSKNMHADDPSFYKIPEERELAAQYLLLYELSLPYGLDLNDRIDIDKSSTRVSVTLDEITTGETRQFLKEVDAWWEARSPGNEVYGTGATYLFSFISERNIKDMIGGNIVAVVLISMIMMLALKSFSFGLLSIIPNVAPLIMTFGVWALLVGEVGMAAATVSATSLGIIVDNTVHILTKYQRAREELMLSIEDAIRYTFDTVGAAVVANALILAFGFSVLMFSSFKITGDMGTLTALAIIIALIVDLLLLPALLMLRAEPKTKGVHYVSTESTQTI